MVILKSVFLLIIFSNHIFAKDFDDLFKISIEIKNENIENSIDRAFNDLVFRLIGYEDLEKAKIIKGNFNSKDFLTRYAVCLLYTSPSPRDLSTSRMPSSA